MRSKASLALMEQLVMVLVFALAAALCLGVFARADSTARQTRHREEGALLAQNAAELLKAGKPAQELTLPEGYALSVSREASPTPGLAVARIDIFFDDAQVFTLRIGWQEAIP